MKKVDTLSLFLLVVITIAVFGSMVWREINFPNADFSTHDALAQELAETSVIPNEPHILYQQLVVAVRAILPITLLKVITGNNWFWLVENSYQVTAWFVCVSLYLWLAVLIYKKIPHKNPFLRIGVTFALMLVTPITLFTISRQRLYLGYIGINVYHNPSIIVLKPLSLLLFWKIIDVCDRPPLKEDWVWTILLVVANAMAKPSYLIVLLPGLVVWLFIQVFLKKKVNWLFMAFAVALPALIIVGFQYALMYGISNSSIQFSPLTAMLHYAPSRKALFFWLLMSLAFPITTFFVYIKQTSKEKRLLLAGIILLFGLILTYFFMETGERQFDLNFGWSAEVALFIFFIESSFFLIKEFFTERNFSPRNLLRQSPLILLFTLHLISGVIFFVLEVIQPQVWWGWT